MGVLSLVIASIVVVLLKNTTNQDILPNASVDYCFWCGFLGLLDIMANTRYVASWLLYSSSHMEYHSLTSFPNILLTYFVYPGYWNQECQFLTTGCASPT